MLPSLGQQFFPGLLAHQSQGVELLNWIAMRGALTGRVSKVHSNYHIPISNTASALLVLDNHAVAHAELRKVG